MWFWKKRPKRRREVVRTPLGDPLQFNVFIESTQDYQYNKLLSNVEKGMPAAPIGDSLHAQIEDLCIQGACVIVPTSGLPDIAVGQLVGLRIEHLQEGWRILAPACVRGRHGQNGETRLGLEFVNIASLYGQLENRLGSYFNRRRSERMRESGRLLKAQIRAGKHRVRVNVVDLSAIGFGGLVSHVEAAFMSTGERISVSLQLHGEKAPIEREATVVRKDRLAKDPHDIVGIEFDHEGWDSADRKRLEAYVDDYLATRLRWSA